jgi:hypothetical protein
MGNYLQKTRAAAKPQTGADAHGSDARSAAPGDGAAPEGSANQPAQASAPRSLVQLRQALDGSPRVRQQAALQRALDGGSRAAAPAKKKPIKEKPSLQRKGIAVNDDAELEREADVMAARVADSASSQSAKREMVSMRKLRYGSAEQHPQELPATRSSAPPEFLADQLPSSPRIVAQHKKNVAACGCPVATQPRRADDPPLQIGGNVVQKVAVERFNLRESTNRSTALDASSQVIQAAEVAVHRKINQGSLVSEELLQTAIETIKEIVEQVEKSGGAANSGAEHERLLKIIEDEKVQSQLPDSSNATFGLGGSNYLKPFTTTQGSAEFGAAVSSHSNSGSTEHLGARDTGMHDEMLHISQYPGLEALASSQGHCFFCFGTIHGRGYQHGALRNAPWPQDWRHDFLGFKLKQTSQHSASIEHAFDPVIKITAEGAGTRYYFVSKA